MLKQAAMILILTVSVKAYAAKADRGFTLPKISSCDPFLGGGLAEFRESLIKNIVQLHPDLNSSASFLRQSDVELTRLTNGAVLLSVPIELERSAGFVSMVIGEQSAALLLRVKPNDVYRTPTRNTQIFVEDLRGMLAHLRSPSPPRLVSMDSLWSRWFAADVRSSEIASRLKDVQDVYLSAKAARSDREILDSQARMVTIVARKMEILIARYDLASGHDRLNAIKEELTETSESANQLVQDLERLRAQGTYEPRGLPDAYNLLSHAFEEMNARQI